MLTVDLNCDMGEGIGQDEAIMPYISSANIACGGHAGDKETMKRTVELARQYQVAIGAHPSYPDKENFGRLDILGKKIQYSDLRDIIFEQLGLLQSVCKEAGATIHHIKLHGALYNRAAREAAVGAIVFAAARVMDPDLVVYGLSGSVMKQEAENALLTFASEVFADRTYQDDGSLTPRTAPNALIEDTNAAVQQVLQMVLDNKVNTVSGKTIPMEADTICIHGDGKMAPEYARTIRDALIKNEVAVACKMVHI